ncbi:MAG: stage VI sporulation protein F [Firmicutes bacterium]|nr:stage VI sporulation protein F [Bacillota bacterium]
MFNFKDDLFNKIEKKTNIGKETILNLASKLQQSDLKDEKTLREVIQELSSMTGKNVSKEKEDKIINAVKNDKVPSDIDKMF